MFYRNSKTTRLDETVLEKVAKNEDVGEERIIRTVLPDLRELLVLAVLSSDKTVLA